MLNVMTQIILIIFMNLFIHSKKSQLTDKILTKLISSTEHRTQREINTAGIDSEIYLKYRGLTFVERCIISPKYKLMSLFA
jgi:hypothetical protein